jgi:tagaturonate reductase
MKELNRQTAQAAKYPTKVIQFGEGNFLRAFVDWIIWNTNKATDFNAGVVVVQPIDRGMVDMLNAQDGLYHVNLQGIDKGQPVDSIEMIDVIKPDLVICGALGLSNFRYALMGSTSTFLSRLPGCDTLVVK